MSAIFVLGTNKKSEITMDFGIFSLCNRRESGQTAAQLIAEARERVVLAEQAGFSTAWFAEHHFSNYSLIPSPLIMVAHCAAVTSRIRLGTGIVIASLYQPARLLSEVAFVDAMTEGRLILGVGSGYQSHELERFDTTVEDSPDMTEEMLDILEGGLTRDVFEYQGKHFSFPRTHMALPPVQKPLPPIWYAGANAQLQHRAARKGYPVIVSNLAHSPSDAIESRHRLERIWEEEGQDLSTLRFATHRFCLVTDSKEEAREYADHCRSQYRLSRYLRERPEELTGGLLPEIPASNEPSLEDFLDFHPIGDAATVAEKLAAEIRAVRPVHSAIYMNAGAFEQKKALRAMERFGAEVLPLLEKELGPLDRIGHADDPAGGAAAAQ